MEINIHVSFITTVIDNDKGKEGKKLKNNLGKCLPISVGRRKIEKNKEVGKGQEMHAHKPKQNSASRRRGAAQSNSKYSTVVWSMDFGARISGFKSSISSSAKWSYK